MKKVQPSFLLVAICILAGCAPPPTPETSSLTERSLPSPGTPPITPEPSPSPQQDFVTLDASRTGSGVSIGSGGDVDFEFVNAGDSANEAWRSGNGRILPAVDQNQVEDWYLAFMVDDGFIYRAAPSARIKIEIEYLDNGSDQFNLHYDAGDALSPSDDWFKPTELITKTGTDTFQTAVFILEDAYFGNRTNGADFRLADNADGPETIRSVRITLLPPGPGASQEEDKELTFNDPEKIVFFNGDVITMDGDRIASGLIVNGETILAVGSGDQMLELAGPDALQIDLNGRALLPGFVDAHSHILNNPWRGDLIGGQALLLENGITASAELFVEEDLIQALQEMDRQGLLRVRTSLYLVHVDNCGGMRGDWYSGSYPASREPGAMLQIPGIKIFNDGGSCNTPAVSFKYPGGYGQGNLYFEPEELSAMIVQAQELGYQVAIHSLGDRAIEANLDAIEIALGSGPNLYRHRIEHNTLLRDDLLERYSVVDPVTTIFGHFMSCIYQGDTTPFRFITPPDYLFMEWRWRDLLDTNPNLHIAWHSDTPYSIGPDTMAHLHSMVTRIQLGEDGTACYPPDWAADDRLTVEEALMMMTIEGAYAIFRENEIGSLTAGKLADIIVLSDNPLEIDPASLAELEVLMTMVGGKIEFCSSEPGKLCPDH